jgi:hypothetical protein
MVSKKWTHFILTAAGIALVILISVVIFVRSHPSIDSQAEKAIAVDLPQPCEYDSYPIIPPVGPVPPPSRIPPDGLSRYRNETFRFSLFYPANETVQEYPEAGGATTIVFQDPKTLEGFQIFVVPYRNPGIVPRRIAKDVISGVVYDRATTTVAGICASSFSTKGGIMPDTVEVWIPKDGHLFEVTTYPGHEDLLQGIIDSWRFL